MTTRSILLATAAALCLACFAEPAAAQDPMRGGGRGGRRLAAAATGYFSEYTGYYQMLWRLYNTSHVPVPPYFALHPPVYYSQPVARTYGYGPYAYPPYVTTPEAKPAAQATPATITNPYVTPAPPKENRTDNETARAPRTVTNPFYVAGPQLARTE